MPPFNIADKSIAAVSLGCDKNRVDTEKMLAILSGHGYSVINDCTAAEIIIVNTCAFIESARKEAVSIILETAEYKKTAKCKKLIITGCLGQKYADEVAALLPEVDAFLGVADYEGLPQVIERLYAENDTVLETEKRDTLDIKGRLLTTPPHIAYLKIADGCDNRCTYCSIPSIRGAYRSRTMESLIEETELLILGGVNEIILVAQDITRYGYDLYKKYALLELLQKLTATDIKRIRLLYCYPELVDDELLNFICTNNKMAKYLDIPIQHSSDRILKLMNRRSNRKSLEALVRKIRSLDTYIAIRTTFIVGFPSESEEDFEDLRAFIANCEFDHIGIFTYSLEKDTPSALIKGKVSKPTARRRQKELAALQLEIVKKKNASFIGKTLRVTYEGIDYKRGLFVGRSEYNAPDVDTNVYFTADFVDIGNEYDIKITGYKNYDLFGEKL